MILIIDYIIGANLMDNVRIFSCGNNLINYNLCISEKVIGFRHMFSEPLKGDIVYLTLKVNNVSHCCARATIGAVTNYAPWEDADVYSLCHKISNIEFCTPFPLDFLKTTSAKRYWGMVYIIGSKVIKDDKALTLLNEHFCKNKCDKMHLFTEEDVNPPKKKRGRKKRSSDESSAETPDDNLDLESVMGADDNSQLNIMGTFKTVKFKNEMDENRGLEALVSNNFYNLFNFFEESNSILIAKNRLFNTKSGTPITGIPDALLITFDSDNKKSAIKIHIVEYECYGEGKPRSTDKFNYLNGHIIPQLIRFASTFSVVTDAKIREDTIKDWTEKIVNYIDEDDSLDDKIHSWIKALNPKARESRIMDLFRAEVNKAFANNIQILLIIDELTSEQRETIKNVINSFKLSDKNKSASIDFAGYAVRLEYALTLDNQSESQYALSFQDN